MVPLVLEEMKLSIAVTEIFDLLILLVAIIISLKYLPRNPLDPARSIFFPFRISNCF